MILDLQARLATAVKDVARRELGAELADVSFQYPPRAELGDVALTAPFDLAKQLRRKPREIAETVGERAGRGARRRAGGGGGRRVREPVPGSRVVRARAAGGAGRAHPPVRRPARDRRAHQHQPQQGRAHRARAQRDAGRHVRAGPAPPRTHGRHPELHRRHRRAGGGRGGGLPAHRGQDARAGRGHRRAGSTTTAGTSTRGSATSTRPTRPASSCRRRRCTRSRPAATRRRGWPSTWPPASSTATWPRWSASASVTSCWPTRATSCASTSGTGPSSC